MSNKQIARTLDTERDLKATLGETQAFATDIASHIPGAVPHLAVNHRGAQVTILSIGKYVLVGIPARSGFVHFEP